MANLMGKPPLGQKKGKPKPDPEYLEEVRQRRCIICATFHEPQMSPTTAHHPIMGRFSMGMKADDRDAIPLCDGHHQGTFDTSKTSIHREPNKWFELYGLDTDYIEPSSH